MNIFACGLGAAIVTFLFYRQIDPRGILIFVGFAIACEIFLQVRWRFSVTCRFCGFDPVLYLKDINAAVAKVKRRLDERRADPRAMLAEPLRLPKIKRLKLEKETMREEAIRRSTEKRQEKRNLQMALNDKAKKETALGQIISKQL